MNLNRLQFDASDDTLKMLDRIADTLDTRTRAEALRASIRVMDLLIGYRGPDGTVTVQGPDGPVKILLG
jgi:hypothetical protein